MADQIWRPLLYGISFLKIEAMRVVIMYVFEGAQSDYHIIFSKHKMSYPIQSSLCRETFHFRENEINKKIKTNKQENEIKPKLFMKSDD